MIEQLSIFVENKQGTLREITTPLSDAGINLKAFSVFDTSYFGILRLLVDQTDKAEEVLKALDFVVNRNCVLGVELENDTGALNQVLVALDDAGIFVNYMYSMVLRGEGNPLMVIDVDDPEKAEEVLKEKGISVQ